MAQEKLSVHLQEHHSNTVADVCRRHWLEEEKKKSLQHVSIGVEHCCYNRLPPVQLLKSTQICYLMVLEVRSPKSVSMASRQVVGRVCCSWRVRRRISTLFSICCPGPWSITPPCTRSNLLLLLPYSLLLTEPPDPSSCKDFVITSGPLGYPGSSLTLKIFNLITPAKSLAQCKVTSKGFRDEGLDISILSLQQASQPWVD